jgi:DNA (cytosine-5)-methyltransferase 1
MSGPANSPASNGGGFSSVASKMTFGSLFAGIGGFDLGLERAGMECRWQVEIEPFCRAVLAKHWPKVKRYVDIRELRRPEPVDLLCGGFPCQDISNAAAGQPDGLAGLDGERSGLWIEFRRLIGLLEPRWIVVENVAALTIRGLAAVLWDITSSGFDSDWAVVSAGGLGASHARKRLFIVGRRRIRFASELPVCDCCRDPYCPDCDLHFFECAHPGPHSWEEAIQDAIGAGLEGAECFLLAQPPDRRQDPDALRPDWGHPAPRIYRRGDGLPGWMDRIKAIGNAVDPRVAEWIGFWRRLKNALWRFRRKFRAYEAGGARWIQWRGFWRDSGAFYGGPLKPFRLYAPVPSENDVEAGCIAILNLHRYWIVRLHAGLFQSMDCRRKIRGVSKGTPDYACLHERHRNFLMEVKRPGAVLSDDQKIQIAVIRQDFGLPVVVVNSIEALAEFLAEHERSP